MAVVAALLIVPVVMTMVLAYVKVLYEWFRKVSVIDASNYQESLNYASRKLKSSERAALFSKEEVKEFPQAPGPMPWPIIGNLPLLASHPSPFQAFTELSKQYGDAYSLTLGTQRCLVLNNLELIQEVLSRNGKYFGDRPNFTRFHQLFGGDRNNSLALCDWSTLQQRRRNLARKHCSPRDTTTTYAKMSEVGILEMHEFKKELQKQVFAARTTEKGSEIYLKPILQATAANLFSHYMCSIRFDYDDKEFQQMVNKFDNVFWYVNEGHPLDFLPWLSVFYSNHLKHVGKWSSDIRDFISARIITDRENAVGEEKEKDFLDALLNSLADDPDVTRDTIMYMLEDFIGGHSAIGNLIMIALGYVALYPEVGRKIQEEIDLVTENRSRDITLFDKERLPYTMAVMFETLRYSSSPIVPHVATEDVVISDFGITKGTLVLINNYKLNLSEKYWTDPEKFQPERFLDKIQPFEDENNNSAESKSTAPDSIKYRLKTNMPHFLPFSIGKRTCIGQNLVRSFGFLMMANVLQNYDVSCKGPETVKTYPACVALPPDTYPLILTPRTKITP